MYPLLLQVFYGVLSLIAPHPAVFAPVIPTQQGPVIGTVLNARTQQFLGIPYAANTSLNRFQPPLPPPVRSQSFDATKWGDACPMDLSPSTRMFLPFPALNVTLSENCLNLNIWAPTVVRQKTAVMIWVYGGSGKHGTSNDAMYNGSYFVNQYDDVTIVTLNYRMNVFGFPNTTGTVNVGFLDIEAAVQWVYKNIANFGGDPERITLFGESFGSVAVDAYAYSHPKDTIVKGLILESGTVYLDEWLAPSANASAWTTLANAVGCNVPASRFTCMQSLPWQVLEAAVIRLGIGFSASPDGYTMFSDWSTRLNHGSYLTVPTLMGTNYNEGDLFAKIYQATGGNLTQLEFDAVSLMLTDVLFKCPAAESAYGRLLHNNATYRYVYYGTFDDITNKTANLRAFHSAEIPLVFNTYNFSTSAYRATPTEVVLGNVIQGSWVAFARNPSGGLRSYGNWTPYSQSEWDSCINVLGAPDRPMGIAHETRLHDLGCRELEAAAEWAKKILGHIKW